MNAESRPSRSERRDELREARRNGERIDLPEGTVAYVTERLYATVTGLAIVRVMESSCHVEGCHARD